MDRRQEVKKSAKDYLYKIEHDAYLEAKQARYAGNDLNAMQRFSENMQRRVLDKINKNCTEQSIKDYLKRQRDSKEYKEAFGGGRDNKDDIDINASLSWS